MHEACHFLYFRKWKEVFPRANPKTFESPHLAWHLSELVAPIILNRPDVQRLLGQRAVFYPEHMRMKMGGIPLPRYLTKQYWLYDANLVGFLTSALRKMRASKKQFT